MAQTPAYVRVANGINYKYESDLSLLVPRAYPKFIQIYADLVSKNYIVMREAQGNMKYTDNKVFYNWQRKGKNLPSFKVTTTATGGSAGASITVTVASGYYEDGGTLSPPAPGHYYFNDTSGQVYQVVSVNTGTNGAHTAVLAPTATGVTASVAPADLLYFYPTVVGERSPTQATIVRGQVRLQNECATIKTSKDFTDWAMFEKLDIPSSGKGYDRIKMLQMDDETDLFLGQQELLLMFGTPVTNIAGIVNNHTGVVPQVIASGQKDVTSTTVNAAWFDNIRRLIDAEGYAKEYDGLLNIELRMKVENFLATTYTAGAIVYAEAFKGQAMEINRNFKAYDFHGIKLNLMTYDYFSSANIAGAAPNTGFYNNAGLWIPRGTALDPESGVNAPRFTVRWQGISENSAPIKLRTTGGWAPTPTDDVEHLTVSQVTTKGVQMFGVNGYMWTQLATS